MTCEPAAPYQSIVQAWRDATTRGPSPGDLITVPIVIRLMERPNEPGTVTSQWTPAAIDTHFGIGATDKPTANAVQTTVTSREIHTSRRPSGAAPVSRRTTSTTVVDVRALSSAEVEFIEAANTAANTRPIRPAGRWPSTNVRNT